MAVAHTAHVCKVYCNVAPYCRSFKHKVFDLFQYILSHLMCMKLTPAFAARLLDLQIENSFSMSASVHSNLNAQDDDRAGYNMMLDTLRGHAIDWFNTAPFDDDVRSLPAPAY